MRTCTNMTTPVSSIAAKTFKPTKQKLETACYVSNYTISNTPLGINISSYSADNLFQFIQFTLPFYWIKNFGDNWAPHKISTIQTLVNKFYMGTFILYYGTLVTIITIENFTLYPALFWCMQEGKDPGELN